MISPRRKSALGWRLGIVLSVGLVGTLLGAVCYGQIFRAARSWPAWHDQQVYWNLTEPLRRMMAGESSQTPVQFEQWSAVALQHPNVVRVALLGRNEQVVASAPPGPFSLRQDRRGSEQPFRIFRRPARGSVDHQDVLEIALLVQNKPLPEASAYRSPSYWPIAVMIVAATAGAAVWQWRLWEGPLQHFLRRAQLHLGMQPVTLRGEEIAEGFEALLDHVNALRRDAVHYYDLTQQLQKQIDSRIAVETRQITSRLRRMEKQAVTDPLTGLHNRQVLEQQWPELFRVHAENAADLCVVMIDLDNFKPLNDTLGHAAGDELLKVTGELLRSCAGEEDLAIRLGGDEFLLVLTNVGTAAALPRIKRLIQLFAQHGQTLAIRQPPTMSVGLAGRLDMHASDPTELIAAADAALYLAKRQGKNTLQIAQLRSSYPGGVSPEFAPATPAVP
ncbi:MAG: hypothetical protein HJJLKODD_00976 [Phycisphaerae bacterium]|nr:hypothetical protein [Phycisphaerae bacterium]